MKNHLRRYRRGIVCLGLLAVSLLVPAQPSLAEDTIKIAYIDPFSGPFAPQGDAYLKTLQYSLAPINASGGALGKKFELITFDDKLQPAEALIALGAATDRNIPFILQCIGSNVSAAMIEGVSKYNARNPDRRVLFLNCSGLATELTNEKCDFWHFRFAGHVSQRVETMVRALPKSLNTVYLMNPDYLYGQSVQRDLKTFLAKLRPDIKIVGDELVPLGKVKDFSPYISKIKASGAQALLTSNWGTDFNQLLKAGMDAGLDVDYYTYSAHQTGGPTAMGLGGVNRVHVIVDSHMNVGNELGNAQADAYMKGFRDIHPDFDYVWINFRTMFEMLQTAVNKAGSTDALKVALALEGLETKDVFGQPTSMRKDDHQLLTAFYQAKFVKDVKFDSEHTGAGWKTEMTIPAVDLAQPTTCNMKRPVT